MQVDIVVHNRTTTWIIRETALFAATLK